MTDPSFGKEAAIARAASMLPNFEYTYTCCTVMGHSSAILSLSDRSEDALHVAVHCQPSCIVERCHVNLLPCPAVSRLAPSLHERYVHTQDCISLHVPLAFADPPYHQASSHIQPIAAAHRLPIY